MSMFRGRFRALKSSTNLRIDAKEDKSNGMTSTIAFGVSSKNLCFISSPSFVLRTAIITCAPFFANTLAVSLPIPLVAPTIFVFVTYRD